MSIGALGGLIGSAAGSPLSQTTGSESERVSRESVGQQRQTDTNQKAERAAGIGETNEDQESSERDADGRRPWELPTRQGKAEPDAASTDAAMRRSKDATGHCGSQLDLTG